MGCRLVMPTADAKDPSEQRETEPIHLTERPSSEDEKPNFAHEEPEADVSTTREDLDPPSQLHASGSAPPTVTSQLSDIVDMCEGMEKEEVQTKAEAVLERILRAQYQLEHLGGAVTPEIARRVGGIDAQFQDFVAEYAARQDDASVPAAHAILQAMDRDLDTLQLLERTGNQ
ncbi:hypothetical protein PHYPSEUDO_003206 [Phytophthora pseudosyringae]|uniref:Uncharacterized protein n=1 Tax=Phytophthora pseudosyringae TaxID=221518 RepID=A0A8T1VVC0_9STRA|nr:hypothetical protein PHYPSEUDO_003206 [Phytophthora pseudosyringae]